MAQSESIPNAVLIEFGLKPDDVETASTGLINRTWYAESQAGRRVVVQRVNPIFAPAVNADIDRLTRHLQRRGVLTPLLVPSRSGALWFEGCGGVWRVLTYIDGVGHEAAERPERAAEAARVLAEFHSAMWDLDWAFENARLGVHDTPEHLEGLRHTLLEYEAHTQYDAIAVLAAELLELAEQLKRLPDGPNRIVHGDPKISNILFDRADDRGLCLIDLDTITRMPIAIELGDALRSWCNPKLEDAPDATFALELFDAAVRAYAYGTRGLLERSEVTSIPDATLTIAVELAARFCRDALEERYFEWDRSAYSTASEHNQARARGQLGVARGIKRQLPEMRSIVGQAFDLQRP